MLSDMKTDERNEARRLRALGWSIREIQAHLGVARSSVSIWVRDVPLTQEQRDELIAHFSLALRLSPKPRTSHNS